MPERIQLRRRKGWQMPPNTVKVDRSTKWGNPFVVGRDGTAAECVHLYRILMAGNICLTCKAPVEDQKRAFFHMQKHIHELVGKNLACWCRLDKPCHADVLLEAVNE